MTEQADRNFLNLVQTVFVEMKSMLRLDARLLYAELSDKFSGAVSAGAWAVAAAALLSFATLLILEGFVFLLIWTGLTAHFACLLVALILIAAAILCIVKARESLRDLSLIPTKTISAVKKDVIALKGAILNVEP